MLKRKCCALSIVHFVFVVTSVLGEGTKVSEHDQNDSRLKRSPQSTDLSSIEVIYAGDLSTQIHTSANTQLSRQETELIISLLSGLNNTQVTSGFYDFSQGSQTNQVTPSPVHSTTTQQQEQYYRHSDHYQPSHHYPPPPPPPPPPSHEYYPPPPHHYPPPPDHCPPPPGHHGPPPDGRPPPKHCPPPPPYHYPPPPPPHHYPPHHYPPPPGHYPPPPHRHGPSPHHHPRPPPYPHERPRHNDIHDNSWESSSESKDPYDIERHGQPIKRGPPPNNGYRGPPDVHGPPPRNGRGPPPNGDPPPDGRPPPHGRHPPNGRPPTRDSPPNGGPPPRDWRPPPPRYLDPNDRDPPPHRGPPPRDWRGDSLSREAPENHDSSQLPRPSHYRDSQQDYADQRLPDQNYNDRDDHYYSNDSITQKPSSATEEQYSLDIRVAHDNDQTTDGVGYLIGQAMAVTPEV